MSIQDGNKKTAVVTGVAPGLGAILCEHLAAAGYRVAGLARSDTVKNELEDKISKIGGSYRHLACDLRDGAAVDEAIASLDDPASVLIHNAHRLHIASFADTDADIFEDVWKTVCLGAVHATHAILPGMLNNGGGTIIFTGATAALKGGAKFSAFASAKFALRGFAQSLAREYSPQGVHVVHTILDGLIWEPQTRERFSPAEEACMDPEAIAKAYLQIIGQDRSVWTHEIDMRPFGESF